MSAESGRLPLLRGLVGIATVIIILAGAKLATAVVSPIFLAIFLALLLGPIYGWLKRRMPAWLAMTGMFIGLLLVFGFLFYLFARSAQSLREGLSTYESQIETNIQNLESALQSVGIDGTSAAVSTEVILSVLKAVIAALVSALSYLLPVVVLCLFLMFEGELLFHRAVESLPNNPVLVRVSTFGTSIARQFGVRGIVNAITGAGFALLLLLLGVDYAVLWGVLTFFLSYVPYIGIVLAGAPAVILAFAEYGLDRALIVVAALTFVNVAAENLLAPSLMGRELNVSTTVTFIGFMFWLWLLGAPGAFMSMPLTILVILLFDSFPETKWLANIAMRSPEAAHTPQISNNSAGDSPNP